jgi:hypothetical protein
VLRLAVEGLVVLAIRVLAIRVLAVRLLGLAEGGVPGCLAVTGGGALLGVFLRCSELLGFRRRRAAVGRLVLRVDRLRGVVRGPVQPEGRILVR